MKNVLLGQIYLMRLEKRYHQITLSERWNGFDIKLVDERISVNCAIISNFKTYILTKLGLETYA